MNNKSHTRKFCDCGNPASVVHNNARICERCYSIDSYQVRKAQAQESRHEIEQADVFTVRLLNFGI